MGMEPIDESRLTSIVESRLLRAPEEIKRFFPPIFSKPDMGFFTYLTDTYFILAFVDTAGRERISKLREKNFHPFPGLIKQENIPMSAAFRLEKARNTVIQGCTVKDMFTLSLGKDSTAILLDHKQSINTKELGVYEYVINLAYIISFGDEINRYNLLDFVEDLIAYSYKQWRSGDGR